MSMPEQNPFASPAAEASRGAELSHLERGPMPVGIIVLLVLIGLGLLGQVVSLVQGEVASIIPLTIGGLILGGIAGGNKLAWQWGRIVGVLAGLLYLLATAGIVFTLIALFSNPEDFQAAAGLALSIDELKWMMVVAAAFVALLLFTCWYMFFILGTDSARRYFKTKCPSCGEQENQSDRLLLSSRCL